MLWRACLAQEMTDVDCLQKRYDQPRLTHQEHVHAILDAPDLKDGNGRELQCLHVLDL